MNKYHLHINNEQQGPFSLEELIEKKITTETMIWYQGLEAWKPAKEIAEINDVLKSTPPPFIPPLQQKQDKQLSNPAASNGKMNYKLLGIIIGMLLIAGIATIYFVNSSREKAALEQRMQEQENLIREQQRIEEERKAEGLRMQRAAELEALKMEYDNAVTQLRLSNEQLQELKKIQFLRTSGEKQQQIEAQLVNIRQWENEVERLKLEINKY